MEISILILLVFLFILITAYLIYFYINKFKKINELKEENSFDKKYYIETHKPRKKTKIISSVIISIFFIFSLVMGMFAIVHKAHGDILEINNEYIVSINSESMSSVNSNNEIVNGEDATRLYKNDIVAFTKINNESELKQYQIILFKSELHGKEILISHRIMKIENGLYYTRGDANSEMDKNPITYDKILGIYRKTLLFPSLLNSMVRSYNFIVFFSFVTTDLIIATILKIIENKKINSQ